MSEHLDSSHSHARDSESHGHHHDHAHAHAAVTSDSERRVLLTMLVTGLFMLAEAFGGWWSGSLALLADAGHMFSDTASLALAYAAFRVGHRAPDRRRTYGYQRFQVLAAFVNGLALFAIAVWIIGAAIKRFFMPVDVLAGTMLWIAVLGLGVNVLAFWILHHGDRDNINMRGAALHVMGDLLGSVAAIIASLIIMATGWDVADPILSMLAAILILRAAWKILRRSTHLLLEGTPQGIGVKDISMALEAIEGVEGVHDIHIWGLTEQEPIISLHLVAQNDVDRDRLLAHAYRLIKERFGIAHVTLQIESGECLTGGDCHTPDHS